MLGSRSCVSGESDAMIAREVEDNGLPPPEAIEAGLAYFLEMFTAREVVEDWIAYLGADPGVKANYESFSHVGPTITTTTAPGLLLDNAEIQFYLAESPAKGFIGGSAATYYNTGVQQSFAYWKAGDASAYLALNPYSLNNLAIQKWVANYNRGWDAWIETRRLDFPVLKKPATGAFSDFPVRFKYPVDESSVNPTNYKAASAAIGGDVVTTRLFFDKNVMPK